MSRWRSRGDRIATALKLLILPVAAALAMAGVSACATSRRVMKGLTANCREVHPGVAYYINDVNDGMEGWIRFGYSPAAARRSW